MSISEGNISGDDSERTAFSPSHWFGKAELANFSCLTFVADIGDRLSWRIFPSDKDLLKYDLNVKKLTVKRYATSTNILLILEKGISLQDWKYIRELNPPKPRNGENLKDTIKDTDPQVVLYHLKNKLWLRFILMLLKVIIIALDNENVGHLTVKLTETDWDRGCISHESRAIHEEEIHFHVFHSPEATYIVQNFVHPVNYLLSWSTYVCPFLPVL